MTQLGLHEAIYLDDKRTKAFGLALDQVWVRGVKIETTIVPELASSDHNPIIATLTISIKRYEIMYKRILVYRVNIIEH